MTLVGHHDTVECCAWSKDGGTIVSCSKDKTLRLWNAATGQECCPPLAATNPSEVIGCAWSPDGRILACCGFDKTVMLFDVQR
jgi:WD40 repeat protein